MGGGTANSGRLRRQTVQHRGRGVDARPERRHHRLALVRRPPAEEAWSQRDHIQPEAIPLTTVLARMIGPVARGWRTHAQGRKGHLRIELLETRRAGWGAVREAIERRGRRVQKTTVQTLDRALITLAKAGKRGKGHSRVPFVQVIVRFLQRDRIKGAQRGVAAMSCSAVHDRDEFAEAGVSQVSRLCQRIAPKRARDARRGERVERHGQACRHHQAAAACQPTETQQGCRMNELNRLRTDGQLTASSPRHASGACPPP